MNSSKQLYPSVRPLVEALLLHIRQCVLGLGACGVLELKLHLCWYVFRIQILLQVETTLAACANYLAKVLISLLNVVAGRAFDPNSLLGALPNCYQTIL